MKTIKSGYTGEEVGLLHDKLTFHGYKVTESGSFSEEMKAAVVEFQQSNGLDADGIVGYRTWEMLFFKNRPSGEKLAEEDFELLAMLLDCETAALKAVQKVETGGKGGFFADGKPAILFEGHVFWNQLKKRNIDPQQYVTGNENVLYPKWDKSKYLGGLKEYNRLEQARKIHEEAANASASWGMFQIMGFNYSSCGEESVSSFVKAMCESECRQLLLSGRFIRNAGMLPALQAKNWPEFARRYNGTAYEQNQYDKKLEEAYKGFINEA